jgi:hypothetical protein
MHALIESVRSHLDVLYSSVFYCSGSATFCAVDERIEAAQGLKSGVGQGASVNQEVV